MPTPRFTRFRPSSASASRIKADLPRLNTSPETALRSSLWALGLRFRLHVRTLPGNPDIVLPRHRAVIFVDGDFWHGRAWFEKRVAPATNSDFWIAKFERNHRRDRVVDLTLRKNGWSVLRLWGSEVKRAPLAGALKVREIGRAHV